jgi:hypothetical protein
MADKTSSSRRVDRRAFIIKGGAGVTAGAAAIAVPAALRGGGDEERPRAVEPSGPTPSEPITAYVRDSERGEVTVIAGTAETTYRDPSLVKRLLAAAPTEEGIDVIAP